VATEDRAGAVAPAAGGTVEEVIRARLSAVLGGLRGSLETALPTVAFVASWVWTHDVTAAVAASAVVVLVLLVARLVARQTTRYVLSAVLATAVAAFFALRSGRAQDAFLPGILTSAAWAAGTVASVLARWPVVGFVVAAGDPRMADDPLAWRRDRGLVRVCQRLTMVLAGLYLLRVAVMLPMYLAGQVTLLGIAKLVLGWPAYLGAVAVMGLILVRGQTAPAPLPDDEPDPAGA
jgi:Protein of unknown function (DUF3159)